MCRRLSDCRRIPSCVDLSRAIARGMSKVLQSSRHLASQCVLHEGLLVDYVARELLSGPAGRRQGSFVVRPRRRRLD